MISKRHTLLPPRLMLILAPVIWSTSNVTGKFAKGLLSAYQFTFYRWLAAAVILTIIFWPRIRRDLPVLKTRWLWLFIWGGSAFALFNILLYGGINRGAKLVDIAIITALVPAFVVIINMLLYRERIHILQWLGVAAALLGVIWLLADGAPQTLLHMQLGLAQVFILGSALIYSSYTAALRFAPDVHWTSLMWAMCAAALAVAAPFYVMEFTDKHHMLIPTAPTQTQIFTAIGLVLYVSIFVAILSKMFYMEGVIAVGGSRGALVMNLLPIFNTLAALLIFRDERASFGAVQLTALLLVVGGIALSEIGAARRHC